LDPGKTTTNTQNFFNDLRHTDFPFIHALLLNNNKITLRSPQMLTPDRIPVAEGKKMENILKKDPSLPRKEGSRFDKKISAGSIKTVVRFICTFTKRSSCDNNNDFDKRRPLSDLLSQSCALWDFYVVVSQ